jgi:hypothetical protein
VKSESLLRGVMTMAQMNNLDDSPHSRGVCSLCWWLDWLRVFSRGSCSMGINKGVGIIYRSSLLFF